MMSKKISHLYAFGPFRLDVGEHLLWRDGESVPLTPKVFDILLVLVESGGRLVEKEELLKAVWPDSFVEEGNLNRNISVLRKALGDAPGEHHYIETVPKLGYRFIASVRDERIGANGESAGTREANGVIGVSPANSDQITPTDNPSAVPLPHPATPPSRRRNLRSQLLAVFAGGAAFALVAAFLWRSSQPQTPAATTEEKSIRSIAVLPFKPLNAEANDEYLGLTTTETLIAKLSDLKQVVVRPLGAVTKYANSEKDPLTAGRELRVEAVLTGSIQRNGDRLRLTAQLVRVQDGAPLWAHTFDEKLTDLLTLHDTIARRVSETLVANLSSEEKLLLARRYTNNPEVYELYLRARYLILTKRTKENLQTSTALLEWVLEMDPKFAPAYHALAISLDEPNAGLSPKEAYQRMRYLAQKAIEVDETYAGGHHTLAFAKWRGDWDWVGAEQDYRRAVELSPNSGGAHQGYGLLLVSQGKFEEGLAEMKHAVALFPTSVFHRTILGALLIYARRYDEAIEELRKVLEMEPRYSPALLRLGEAYAHKGMYAEALDAMQKALAIEELTKHNVLGFLGYVHALTGNHAEALKAIDELKKVQDAQPWAAAAGARAVIYAALDRKEQAFAALNEAIERHEWWASTLKVNPLFDNLRSNPRFPALLQRTGLSP